MNVGREQKGGEDRSGWLFDHASVFPDDDRQTELAVLRAEFSCGAFVGTKRQAGELGQFAFLLMLQWFGAWGDHFST